MLPIFAPGIILACWVLAILTALVSILYLRRRPRSWYAWLNLLINISGLVFTIGLLVFVVVGAVAADALDIPIFND
ncbi:MAG: hypothetical protein WBD40_07370 [Tepidisphaeraceae bacterium]